MSSRRGRKLFSMRRCHPGCGITHQGAGRLAMKPDGRTDRLSVDVLSVLRDSVHDKIFPGAVAALISSADEICIPFGFETYDAMASPITEESIFDVASLTKVVATATAIMQLVERKQLALHDL